MARTGRPKQDHDWLAMEVHRLMQAFDIGADEACRRISIGWKAPAKLHYLVDGKHKSKKVMTVGSRWKGIKPGTLAGRYWRWRRAEQKRQQAKNKPTDKIPKRLTT